MTVLKVRVGGAWEELSSGMPSLTDGQRLLGRETGPGPAEEVILGEYITITDGVLDVAGAGATSFIVQSLAPARQTREGKAGDYLPRAQETALLESGFVTVTTGTGVLGSTPTIPANLITGLPTPAPVPVWVAVPFNAADFAADEGTWAVTQGNLTTFAYCMLSPTVMVVDFNLATSVLNSIPSGLYLKIPNGKSAKQVSSVMARVGYPTKEGLGRVNAQGASLVITFLDLVQEKFRTFPAGTVSIQFQITLNV